MTRPPIMPNEDYEAIEAAVMDSARGRWFLAEFARRNRSADTAVLLEAIERLEHQLLAREEAMRALPPPKPHEPVQGNAVVTSASSELFALEPPHPQPKHEIPPATVVPEEVAWVEEQARRAPAPPSPPPPAAPHPPEIFEIEDEMELLWPGVHTPPVQPAPQRTEPMRAPPPPSVPEPAPVAASQTYAAPAHAETPRPSAQSSMLAAALAQAEETVARVSEPAPPPPPGGTSPQAADPAELDALSFEEKSVYFA